MKKTLLSLILLGLYTACRVMPEGPLPGTCSTESAVQVDHEAKEELDSLIEAAVADGLVGGTVYLHSAGGTYARAFGLADLQSDQATQLCQQYRIASLTKVFTATLVMQLAESGQLSLEAKVTDYLAEAQVSGITEIDQISIAQLLNHTSGIPNYDDDVRFAPLILNKPGRAISLEEKLQLVRSKGGRVPKWVIKRFGQIYSNTNYLLLQLVIEKVTDQAYDQVLREQILEPLALHNTVTSRVTPFPAHLARGYVDFYGNDQLRDVWEWDAHRFDAEGSVVSTAADLYIFYDALLSGRLLSAGSLDRMKQERLGLLQEEFELENALGHDGIAIGYSAEMWHLPRSGLTLVFLSNQGRLINENWSVLRYENLLRRLIEVAR